MIEWKMVTQTPSYFGVSFKSSCCIQQSSTSLKSSNALSFFSCLSQKAWTCLDSLFCGTSSSRLTMHRWILPKLGNKWLKPNSLLQLQCFFQDCQPPTQLNQQLHICDIAIHCSYNLFTWTAIYCVCNRLWLHWSHQEWRYDYVLNDQKLHV